MIDNGFCCPSPFSSASDVEKFVCEYFTVKKKYSLIYFSLDGIVNSDKNLAKNGKDAVFSNSPTDQHEPRCHRGLDSRVWLTVSPSNFEHYPILGKHHLQ
jgi:hypothetical protein